MIQLLTTAVVGDMAASTSEHKLILDSLSTRFTDLYFWIGILIVLILGGYAFTGGAYLYTWAISARLEKFSSNHLRHLERKVAKLLKHNGLDEEEEE